MSGRSGTLALTGGPVEYRWISGDTERDPVVLLHEGLGCVAMWGRFPAALTRATGRSVLAYSRHGYGGSGPARLPRSVRYLHDEATQVLPELLDRFGVRRPVLVGHSDGASIALLHAAAGCPVAGLVLLAPHVFVEERTLAGIRAAADRFDAGTLADRLSWFHTDPAAVFRGWSDVWLSSGFRAWNIEAALGRVDQPVLVIQGEGDEYGTTRQLDAVERGVRGPVRRWELADCGHSPHLERTDQIVAETAAFLAGQDNAAGTSRRADAGGTGQRVRA